MKNETIKKHIVDNLTDAFEGKTKEDLINALSEVPSIAEAIVGEGIDKETNDEYRKWIGMFAEVLGGVSVVTK